MLVPLDLSILAQKVGRLSPSLVLGWRVGNHVREMFDGLDEVRLAAAPTGDFLLGLRATLTESRFPLDVLPAEDEPDWHALAWHAITGTLLRFTFAVERVAMDARGAAALPDVRKGNPYGLAAYAASLDRQVLRLLDDPMETLCRIEEHMVSKSRAKDGDPDVSINCRRCGNGTLRTDLWYADGAPCCPDCAGLIPAWTFAN